MKHLIAALAFALFSCTSTSQEKKEKPEKSPLAGQTVVGRIASVSKVGRFVLIQKFGPGILPTNVIYQSRGLDNRSASLRPSGERIRDFYAADLLNGRAEKGDAVVAYAKPPNDDEPSAADAKSTPETSENDGSPEEAQENNQDSKIIKEGN